MNLILGDRRSPENGESGVRENRLVRLARRPILARHVAVIGGGSAPGETVALVIGTHAMKAVAPSQLSFEVIDA
jgi:hypothetical protein